MQKKSELDYAVKARDSRSQAKGPDFEEAKLRLREMPAVALRVEG